MFKTVCLLFIFSLTGFGQQEKSTEEVKLSEREKIIQLEAQEIRLQEQIKALQKTANKKQSPEEKKARGIVSKREKNQQKSVEREAKALVNANITGCPSGVWVNPEATGRHSFQAYARIVVVNASGLNVFSITDGYTGRTVVTNLCPGGSVSLFKALDFMRDSNTLSYRYIATTHFPDTTFGTAYSPQIQISQYQNADQGAQTYVWLIQFEKHIPQK